MGFAAAVAATVVIGGSMAYGARQQKKMREAEEEQTRLEAERLTALQQEIAASEAGTPMPDPQDQRRAKRRSIAEQMRRRGRASTILTGDSVTSDPLG